MPWLPNLSGAWGKVVAGLAAAAAFIGALLLAIGRLKQAGRDQERAEQAARNDEFRREANEVRDRVDASGRTELDDGVRKWTRPD